MDLAKKVEELIKLTTSLKDELNALKGDDINTKVTELEKEMAALKNDVNELRYCLMKQNAKILALIHRLPATNNYDSSNQEYSEHISTAALTNFMENAKTKIRHCSKLFPLSTIKDLDDFDKSINETNIQEIINVIRQLIMPQGIIKNIGFVLSDKVVMECNLEGQHRKDRLLNYTQFMDVLFQAAYADGYSLKAFLADLRHGLKLARKRFFKNRLRVNPPANGRSNQEQYDDDYNCESDNCQGEEDDRSSPTTIIKVEENSMYD